MKQWFTSCTVGELLSSCFVLWGHSRFQNEEHALSLACLFHVSLVCIYVCSSLTVRLVNRCFATCTSRVQPFTDRIVSTVRMPFYMKEISFTCKFYSFSYEWLCTRPRFDGEATCTTACGLGSTVTILGIYSVRPEYNLCQRLLVLSKSTAQCKWGSFIVGYFTEYWIDRLFRHHSS